MMVDKTENSNIPEYQLGTKSNIPKDSKDRDHFDKTLNNKLPPVSNNYGKKEASPTSGSSLPRSNMNKRNFDVAFLAGNTFENDKIPDENCDDQTGNEKCETNMDGVHQISREKQLVFNDGSKSAFTKVYKSSDKQHDLSLSVASRGNEKEPFPPNHTYIDIDKHEKDEFDGTRNKGDKNGTKVDEKDNESACMISPKGKTQSLYNDRKYLNENSIIEQNSYKNVYQNMPKQDNENNNSEVNRKLLEAGYKNEERKPPIHPEKGLCNTTACEPRKTLSSSAIHLSALLSSKTDTLPPENYLNRHSSPKRDSNSELDINSSTKLNLLRFPAFKRFMDSPSVQQKSAPERFSAFSSIKSKQESQRAHHTSLQHANVLPSPSMLFSPPPPAPPFPTFHPPLGLASLIASPLLTPSPAAVVAAASSARNCGPRAASTGGSFVPSNTCAKCGVTFRMTSDLVYHMRTHHAKEASETSYEKRRHVDSLTCNVCGENFRERHHLTRHMTAHVARKGEQLEEKSPPLPDETTSARNNEKINAQQNIFNYGRTLGSDITARASSSSIKDNSFQIT